MDCSMYNPGQVLVRTSLFTIYGLCVRGVFFIQAEREAKRAAAKSKTEDDDDDDEEDAEDWLDRDDSEKKEDAHDEL